MYFVHLFPLGLLMSCVGPLIISNQYTQEIPVSFSKLISYCGWLLNPAPPKGWLNAYNVMSTTYQLVQDSETIHCITASKTIYPLVN